MRRRRIFWDEILDLVHCHWALGVTMKEGSSTLSSSSRSWCQSCQQKSDGVALSSLASQKELLVERWWATSGRPSAAPWGSWSRARHRPPPAAAGRGTASPFPPVQQCNALEEDKGLGEKKRKEKNEKRPGRLFAVLASGGAARQTCSACQGSKPQCSPERKLIWLHCWGGSLLKRNLSPPLFVFHMWSWDIVKVHLQGMDDLLLTLSHLIDFLQPRRVWSVVRLGWWWRRCWGRRRSSSTTNLLLLLTACGDKTHLRSGELSLSYWRTHSGPPWGQRKFSKSLNSKIQSSEIDYAWS